MAANHGLAGLTGRRVVVWGWGNEGRAAQRLLTHHALPASVTVIDDADAPSDEHVRRGADARHALALAEVIVKSPGVSPYRVDVVAAATTATLTGGTALWFEETGGERTIAVTGSKGKSTTSSLIAHLLEGLGAGVALAGNVGRALLDLLDDDLLTSGTAAPAGRWNVLELSSFQTAEVDHSPVVGVLTALFPEHLDWHLSVERYYADKINLFGHRPSAVVAANIDNADVAARLHLLPNPLPYGRPGGIHPTDATIADAGGETLLALDASPLLGRHNAINLCGALSAVRAVGFDLAAEIASGRLPAALASFRPLAHRLERVGEVGGRLVVDDGLSTAPQAAVAALAAFAERPVSIIVGGHDRGLDYGALAAAVGSRSQPTWVLGVPESGPRIMERVAAEPAVSANDQVNTVCFDDFDDAIVRALEVTPRGGVILLSPAAPSFGRFTNYVDRSRHFRHLVGLREESDEAL